jgi:hypothetical protein
MIWRAKTPTGPRPDYTKPKEKAMENQPHPDMALFQYDPRGKPGEAGAAVTDASRLLLRGRVLPKLKSE